MCNTGLGADTKFLSQTCCFTGHRKIPKNELPLLKEHLRMAIVDAVRQGYRYFGAGGALGFDTIAAEMVLEMKHTYPQIRLILVLPCETQTRGWQTVDVAVYESIKRAADKVVYTSTAYYTGCMQRRNRYLVDNSSLCICYLKKEHSGTGYTVWYAKEKERRIINLA